jgi:hypothetical protein
MYMHWVRPVTTTNPYGLNGTGPNGGVPQQARDQHTFDALLRIEALLTRIAVQLEAPK